MSTMITQTNIATPNILQSGNITFGGNMGIQGVAGGGLVYPVSYPPPNYGVTHLGMPIVQYSPDMDALSLFNGELLKDYQVNDVPDAIFPSEFDLVGGALRFHLLVWRQSNSNIDEKFWNIIGNSSLLEGKLMFRSRRYRRNFQNWWKKYTNIFFNGISPINDFLPKIKPGRISGTFVEQPNSLDLIAYNQSFSFINVHNMIKGLTDALPSWIWIVANCKRPVLRQSGGWLFTSGTEAAKFILFAPLKNS